MSGTTFSTHPLLALPQLSLGVCGKYHIPTEAECQALWDKYGMLEHIRAHSMQVAQLAAALAQRAVQCGFAVDVEAVYASALLHDIAKTYTIAHGGSHAQMGASWVVAETGNYLLAQGVMHHVHWPWPIKKEHICALPFFIIYADKRVMHDHCVTLEERFDDLLVRYGRNEFARASIRESHALGQTVEHAFSELLELELHAYTLDSGRLVQRT